MESRQSRKYGLTCQALSSKGEKTQSTKLGHFRGLFVNKLDLLGKIGDRMISHFVDKNQNSGLIAIPFIVPL
jgi:hypothetical protein